MSGPKRNPDALNTIGIVVVGICGAVLVYVTIVALQAFYVNDSSEIQTMADYGGQDTSSRSLRTEQVNKISEYGSNPKPVAPKANETARPQTFRVPIAVAMKAVVEGAKTSPNELIPTVGKSEKSTVLPIFGRPQLAPTAPAAPAAGGDAAAPAAGDAAAGAGSNATTLPTAPQAPTGAGAGPSPVGGAGALDKAATPGTPDTNPPPPAANRPAGTTPSPNADAQKPAAPAPAKGNGK